MPVYIGACRCILMPTGAYLFIPGHSSALHTTALPGGLWIRSRGRGVGVGKNLFGVGFGGGKNF
jgi:hypothetical protein